MTKQLIIIRPAQILPKDAIDNVRGFMREQLGDAYDVLVVPSGMDVFSLPKVQEAAEVVQQPAPLEIRGQPCLVNALIAVVGGSQIPRLLGTSSYDVAGMTLSIDVHVTPEQIEAAATLLRSTLDQPTRKAKEATNV